MAASSNRRLSGPLGPFVEGFGEELRRHGYAERTIIGLVRLTRQLSGSLEQSGLGVEELSDAVVSQFLAAHNANHAWHPTTRTLTPLLDYLRAEGVLIAADPTGDAPSAADRLCNRFRRYLIRERGLVEGTIENYVGVAKTFLSQRPLTDGRLDPVVLTPAMVAAFVTAEVPRHSVGSARNLLTGLRALLRFLHVEGLTTAPLDQAVPIVAGWSGDALPRALSASQVRALLSSCDRRRATGRRDYAVLLMMARLGLRAGEIAALELDDLDWRAGEIVIRGKGNHFERLPLPADVGEALAGYLRRGRPASSCRRVFLCVHAPIHGLAAAGASDIVARAGRRAGIAGTGAHRLRHTAATEMLRAGASLREVALVLRHRNTATTSRYAKVDQVALSSLVRTWPGGRS